MEMPEVSKKSIITFLMIGIVLLAIPFSVKYLQQTNILKTRATGDEITFVAGDNINCDGSGKCKTAETTVQVLLKSPLGPPATPSATPSVTSTPTPSVAPSPTPVLTSTLTPTPTPTP